MLNDKKTPLSIQEVMEELKHFHTGNPLGHSSEYPFRLIEDYTTQQHMDWTTRLADMNLQEFNAVLPQVLYEISLRVKYIKEKYARDFASHHEMYGVLAEEIHELFTEICAKEENRDYNKVRAEALDIIVVLVRFLAEERVKFGR